MIVRRQCTPNIYFLEVILHKVWSFYIFHFGSCFSHWWLILEVFVLFEAYPFWEDIFILGHSHLTDFVIETWPFIYDCYFRWIIELLTHWVQSSQHTWFDSNIHLPLLQTWHFTSDTITPTSIVSGLIDIKPTYFVTLHDLIPFSWLEKDINQSWVFWSSFHIPLDVSFDIFYDGRAC